MNQGLPDAIAIAAGAIGAPFAIFIWWKLVARGTSFQGFVVFHLAAFGIFGAVGVAATGPASLTLADWVWMLCTWGGASLLVSNTSESISRAAQG